MYTRIYMVSFKKRKLLHQFLFDVRWLKIIVTVIDGCNDLATFLTAVDEHQTNC